MRESLIDGLFNYNSQIQEEQSPNRAALANLAEGDDVPQTIHIMPEMLPLSPSNRHEAGASTNVNDAEQGGLDHRDANQNFHAVVSPFSPRPVLESFSTHRNVQ